MSFRWRTVLCLFATVLTVEGCASPGKPQHTNWAVRQYDSKTGEAIEAEEWVCEAFRPITFSDQDTTATKAQIVEHNAVWDALCPEDMK